MTKTGKIFKVSNNIYEDQARLLFYYYSKAAERIVQQEEALEQSIAQLQEDYRIIEEKKSTTWKWFLTIVLFFMYFIRNKDYDKQLAEINALISQKEQEYQNIFRNYRVSKLGVAYVPIAKQIQYGDSCFIVDYTGQVSNSEVCLQIPRQNDLLVSTMSQVETLTSEAPIIETSSDSEPIDTNEYSLSIQSINQNDYIGQLDRSLRTITYCMGDTDIKSVSLPLVHNDSEYLTFLNEYTIGKVDGYPIINVFDDRRFEADIQSFNTLNQMKDALSKDTEQFEDVLQHMMRSLAMTVQTVTAMKLASTNKVISESNELLLRLLKAPYNHYSPLLEAEEINRIRNERFEYSDNVQGYEPFHLKESSRVRYNLFADEWVAEDNSVAPVPFGMHQIYEEIVAPMVQRLMAENRVERIKIYGQIHDQKMSYLTKWHQDVDAFYRSNHAESADIINNMQKTLAEYIEAFNTLSQLQKTLDTMKSAGVDLDNTIVEVQENSDESLAAFELQAQEFKNVQDEFTDYMERLQEDIQLKAEQFGHVEFYDASLQDGHSNAVAVAASEVANLDKRRKGLAAANPLLAKSSVMPPEPKVEEITFEHLSLNLPSIATNALEELNSISDSLPRPRRRVVLTTSDNHDQMTPPTEMDMPELPNLEEDFNLPSTTESDLSAHAANKDFTDKAINQSSSDISDLPELPAIPDENEKEFSDDLPDLPDEDIPDLPEEKDL